MKNVNWKELFIDILVDIVAGMIIAVGIYNFALNADFPVAGFSGIAIILYHLFGLPVGAGTIILNVPVAIFCYKFLGKEFFLKSMKSMIISSLLMDYVAPLFPVYQGDRLLSAICCGVLSGLGYAMIYMRDSSTGGSDFIMMSIKALNPHLSLGNIAFALDAVIVILGTVIVSRDVDSLIYGLIVSYLLSLVMDKVMYGIDEGKLALIVTDPEHSTEICFKIDEVLGRGSTILNGMGSYSKDDKHIIMCACNNKQMYGIRKLIKTIDPKSFLVIMESNDVVGEGFKDE